MSDPVAFKTIPTNSNHQIAIATLNAEKSLNSLSVEMVERLTPQLKAWQQDSNIVCVLLKGAGDKAFCAGGDIRRLYDTMIECGPDKPNHYAEAFFEKEYRLDYLIHKYRKPLIVWGHGIVMGGGIGLMSGASHRVVTEKSRLAMPEINIGLYPDVGGTWFLNHAPGRTGLFLGLTGANINAADALFVGLADRYLPHDTQDAVIQALTQAQWNDKSHDAAGIVSKVLRQFEDLSQLPASEVRKHYDLIQQVTDGDNMTEIADRIFAIDSDDKWLQKAVKGLQQGCPTTAHLVYQQLKRGSKLSLEEVFRMELIMSLQCSRHPDFPEGVRALLVDKDGQPKWQHSSVAEVPHSWVEEHFTPPWGEGENPLSNIHQI
ncbi:MAG: enoyl-CoA hydratase/isomerase family protein [Ketobacteraceae bacterium]|nr:enoyl-CoA hydratase/isomerase family protein [Ketobacteraceae bacterium]